MTRAAQALIAAAILPLDMGARVWRALGDLADAVDRHYAGRLGGGDE